MRTPLLFVGLLLHSFLALLAKPGLAQELITRSAASHAGLERAWFTVVEIDPSRGRLVTVMVEGDLLVAVTDQGSIQGFDAETGEMKWKTMIGKPGYPTLGPSVSKDHIAALNGSRLYLMDRATGAPLWDISVSAGPGAAPCLTKEFVFVPMINGSIQGFNISDPKKPQWNYQSVGRAVVQPTPFEENFMWPTDRGYLYVAKASPPKISFRFETQRPITKPPTYLTPYIFTASQDGFIYAFHHTNNEVVWRTSLGETINSAPVAVKGKVFIASDRPEMYALDAKTGEIDWKASGIAHILAVSDKKLYAIDRFNRMSILDLETGIKQGELNTVESNVVIVNHRTDRIYLATPRGLIQCLHEVDLKTPLLHESTLDPATVPAGGADEKKDAVKPDTKEPMEKAEDDPFG